MKEKEANWKERQFEILCRVNEICRTNNIDIYLCDSTALKAYCEGDISDSIFVAIEPRDAYRFINAIKEQSEYSIRGIFNYHHYSEFDLKVYDDRTIDFSLGSYEDLGFCGLYVTVKFILHLPKDKRTRVSYLRELREYSKYISARFDRVEVLNRRLKLELFFKSVIPPKYYREHFFKQSIKKFDCDSQEVKVGEAVCDAEIFEKKEAVYVRGETFYVPGNPSEYFLRRYGAGWMTRGVLPYEEENYKFRDGDHSWEEFKKYINYLDLDEYYSNRRIANSNKEKGRKNDSQLQKDKYIVERTHLRFVFWQKYMPIKQELKAMHQAGNYEQLQEVLKPYLKELERFAKSGLGVCFDTEIYDIAKDLLIASGKTAVAEKLTSIVPKEHMAELRIKNSNGEYV